MGLHPYPARNSHLLVLFSITIDLPISLMCSECKLIPSYLLREAHEQVTREHEADQKLVVSHINFIQSGQFAWSACLVNLQGFPDIIPYFTVCT